MSPAPFLGVFVQADTDTRPRPARSLMRALTRPPASPEATIFAGAITLARSHEASAVWVLTDDGRNRLRAEDLVSKGLVKAVCRELTELDEVGT